MIEMNIELPLIPHKTTEEYPVGRVWFYHINEQRFFIGEIFKDEPETFVFDIESADDSVAIFYCESDFDDLIWYDQRENNI